MGQKQYVQPDGGAWKTQAVSRDFYGLVHSPINFHKDEKIPPFEIVEQEWLDDGGVLARIRYRAPQAVDDEDDTDRPNFWIEIHKDGSLLIKRYSGPAGYQGQYVTSAVEYEMPDRSAKPVQAPRLGKGK